MRPAGAGDTGGCFALWGLTERRVQQLQRQVRVSLEGLGAGASPLRGIRGQGRFWWGLGVSWKVKLETGPDAHTYPSWLAGQKRSLVCLPSPNGSSPPTHTWAPLSTHLSVHPPRPLCLPAHLPYSPFGFTLAPLPSHSLFLFAEWLLRAVQVLACD